MRIRNIVIFAAAVFAGALGGSIIGPRPAEAVAREIIDMQRDITSLLQGQRDMTTQITTDHTVLKTLLQQASDNVDKLNSSMGSVQKSVQDVQANSGARLDTMSTQVQGLSDNLEEIKSRLGKLNQQIVDLQSAVQSVDTGIFGRSHRHHHSGQRGSAFQRNRRRAIASAQPNAGAAAGPAPSADMLYSNGLRDITSGKYNLARQEFRTTSSITTTPTSPPTPSFISGNRLISEGLSRRRQRIRKSSHCLPKKFKLAPALLKKGMALIELGQKPSGVRDLREVVRRYPGTEEEHRAHAKLEELGIATTAAN